MTLETKQLIIDWIDEELGIGGVLRDAATACMERIIRSRKSPDALRAVGIDAFIALWRYEQRQAREDASAGERRVDNGLLQGKGLSNCLFEIGGRWLRLGDLRFQDCAELISDYEKRAAGNLRWARFFRSVAKKLYNDVVVADRFSDDELVELMVEAG